MSFKHRVSDMLRPPKPFEPQDLEDKFLLDYGSRAVDYRRAATVIALGTWVSYFGWDFLHGYHDGKFEIWVWDVVALRGIGVALLILLLQRAFKPSFKDEKIASTLCIAGTSTAFCLILAMILFIPFPINFLYYNTGLLLVLIFGFGLLRLRAKGVYYMNGGLFLACVVTYMAADRSHHHTTYEADYLPAVAALFYVASFCLTGAVVAIELERVARDNYLRELELAEINSRLEISQATAEARTSAIIALKEEARIRAEQENVQKSKYLADAAHDLRQPMQALSGFLTAAEFAANRKDLETSTHLIQQAQNAARLTAASFRALLELSQLESGIAKADITDFVIDDLLKEILIQFEGRAAQVGVTVRVRDRKLPPVVVRSDRNLLSRGLMNLVSNAVKYSDHAKGANCGVIISVVRLPSRARIDIIDNGIGIPKQVWSDIFQPFYQVNNPERDRDKGLGLGLSILNAIISLLPEHRIYLASKEKFGTRFSIDLPLGLPMLAASPLEHEPAALRDVDISGLYVIYVEDDKLVRSSIVAIFDALGVLYEAVNSFSEFLKCLSKIERQPDIIITDYRLPGSMTGPDVIAALRAEFQSEVPAIILTGEVREIDAALPNVVIVQKPILPSMLIQQIKMQMLSQPQAA